MKEKAFPHGGNLRALAAACGRDPADILDASASINPLGPPPWLRDVVSAGISDLIHYPDPEATDLIAAAVPSEWFEEDSQTIIRDESGWYHGIITLKLYDR